VPCTESASFAQERRSSCSAPAAASQPSPSSSPRRPASRVRHLLEREKIERAKELGATGGALYTEGDWAEAIVELAGGGVNVVLDSVGSTWGDSVRALGRAGRLVVFGATGGPQATVDVRGLYLGWRSIRGTTLGSARDFAALLEMVERGAWRPVIDSVRPLAEAEAAHDRMARGDHFGKLVLSVAR
jgi:NADPH:quinone reductase-like Zn-dependent oxidoreductase